MIYFIAKVISRTAATRIQVFPAAFHSFRLFPFEQRQDLRGQHLPDFTEHTNPWASSSNVGSDPSGLQGTFPASFQVLLDRLLFLCTWSSSCGSDWTSIAWGLVRNAHSQVLPRFTQCEASVRGPGTLCFLSPSVIPMHTQVREPLLQGNSP